MDAGKETCTRRGKRDSGEALGGGGAACGRATSEALLQREDELRYFTRTRATKAWRRLIQEQEAAAPAPCGD